LAWPVMLMTVLILTWSSFTKLEEVTITKGEVISLGDFLTIQHLEGGIVKEIHVQDGQIINKGSALILLDLATSAVNREELQVRLDEQILLEARLQAEVQGKRTITFPSEAAKRRPKKLTAERQHFEARRRQLNSTISALSQAVSHQRQDVKKLDAQIRAINKNLNLAKKRFVMSKNLLANGLLTEMEYLQIEAEVESLEGEAQNLDPSLFSQNHAILEAEDRASEELNRFRSGAREELVLVQQAISRINELLTSADKQDMRVMIRSPIDGVVQNINHTTTGGVIHPSEPIMKIVPTGNSMVIDAKLKPADRAFVTINQKAMVKLSTYDYAIFGGLEGKVTMVAPDTIIDEKGDPFFRIFVKTNKTYIGDDPELNKITPGMQATVDINTGGRSVLKYLIMPLQN
jgi:adhesin transport system membrane fusion protein